MTGMILNTEFAFDQVGNSPAGPQRRCVAERFRASFQQLAEALQIRFAQLRLAAHASGLLQRVLAALGVLLRPPAHRLAADFQPNRDFGLVEISLLQQSNGFHPALLQRIKITCHSSRIPHTESNSFSRQKCRYIMRSSIVRTFFVSQRDPLRDKKVAHLTMFSFSCQSTLKSLLFSGCQMCWGGISVSNRLMLCSMTHCFPGAGIPSCTLGNT